MNDIIPVMENGASESKSTAAAVAAPMKRVVSNSNLGLDDDDDVKVHSSNFNAKQETQLESPPAVMVDAMPENTDTASTTSSSLSDRCEMKRIDSKVSTESSSSSHRNGSGNWGYWFEHVDDEKRKKDFDAPTQDAAAPTYVLGESLSSQRLWKDTAGNRPPQPVEERALFEKMWAQNFARSKVNYQMPVEVLTATSPISLSPFAEGLFEQRTQFSNYNIEEKEGEATLMNRLVTPSPSLEQHQHNIVNKTIRGSGSESVLTVLVQGDNVFGTTVSKSFAKSAPRGGPIEKVTTVNISIASYRVIDSKKHGKYAQFLVVYREGSIRDTIGVWKRYSDFAQLSRKVTHAHESCSSVLQQMSPLAITEEQDIEHLPNAITSWRLLKKRQRWYRCLDAGYLSLKVFLLERFLHDILFESSSPRMLRDFVGNLAESLSNTSIENETNEPALVNE